MMKTIFLLLAAFAVFETNGLLTYQQNVYAIDPYFCLYKDEGNYVHPNGACDYYIACGRGCKKANHGNYNFRCTQHPMPCGGGLFFDPNYAPRHLSKAEQDHYRKRNLGGCNYKEMSTCHQFQAEVCYGAKNNQHGVFRPASSGLVTKLTLKHKSGGVSCVPGKYRGFWGGCAHESARGRPMNIWITADKNFRGKSYSQIKYDVKFPIPSIAYEANQYGFYGLDEFNDKSPYIDFISGYGEEAVSFSRYHNVRVIYGEDLFDKGAGNNRGRHCIYVYALFYDPKLNA